MWVKTFQRKCQKTCQNWCQIKCQTECQTECRAGWQKECHQECPAVVALCVFTLVVPFFPPPSSSSCCCCCCCCCCRRRGEWLNRVGKKARYLGIQASSQTYELAVGEKQSLMKNQHLYIWLENTSVCCGSDRNNMKFNEPCYNSPP